jgi:hypothetical protein
VSPGNACTAFNGITTEAGMAVRKDCIEERENWLTAQKIAGTAGDREMAKFCKEQWKYAEQTVKACGLILGWMADGELPGDCVRREFKDWPKELVPALNEVQGRMFLRSA